MRDKAIKTYIKTCNVKDYEKTGECLKCWHTRNFIDEMDK
nr:MAG TPA: hypothetical protein [Caudoviricetes sp.]